MAEKTCPHCGHPLNGSEQYCPSCGQYVQLALPAGTIVQSRGKHQYAINKVLGQGGFGITYRAESLATKETVALKEYFPTRCQPQRRGDCSIVPVEGAQDAYKRGLQSFLGEASMLKAVENIPQIVHVLDFFEANGTAYMVMEYLDGITLQKLITTKGALSMKTLLPKFLPLIRDIAKLHEAGVVHRDIAPDNIMWMPDGSLKLLDFGCARSMEDGRSMTVMLKPGFAPLEQYTTKGQGPHTDTYSLCATLYYCLTAKVPPASPDRLSALSGEPDPLIPPIQQGAKMSQEQERILLWGLSLESSNRPAKISDFAVRLEAAQDMTEEPKPPADDPGKPEKPTDVKTIDDPQPPEPKKPEPQQNQKIYIIAAAVMIVIVACIFLSRLS